jgi:hypothetical protein
MREGGDPGFFFTAKDAKLAKKRKGSALPLGVLGELCGESPVSRPLRAPQNKNAWVAFAGMSG